VELLRILRLLWRRRVAVGLGALIVIALAAAAIRGVTLGPLGGVGGQQVSAVVSGRVLVDTADSELVHVDPKAIETLAMRATLWAELLASEPARERIARHAHLAPDELAVLGPSTRIEPAVLTPLVTRASPAALAPPEPNVLRVYASQELPLIALEATADEERQARLLMDAAVAELRSLVAPEGTAAAQPFVVEPFASPSTTEIVSRSGRLRFVLVGVVAFGLWCCAIVIVEGTAGGRRTRRAPA
jgi:hypothetical protein